MLRHYEKYRLVAPWYIDESTGYRYDCAVIDCEKGIKPVFLNGNPIESNMNEAEDIYEKEPLSLAQLPFPICTD